MSNKTIDPLLILKEHIQQNKKVDRQGAYLLFSDGLKLRLDLPTACIQSQSNKQYTLGSLYYYLKHRSDPLATYIKEIQKERIDTVAGMDKGKSY
jgi:hypothetical protein